MPTVNLVFPSRHAPTVAHAESRRGMGHSSKAMPNHNNPAHNLSVTAYRIRILPMALTV
jgi:hypothetical protein